MIAIIKTIPGYFGPAISEYWHAAGMEEGIVTAIGGIQVLSAYYGDLGRWYRGAALRWAIRAARRSESPDQPSLYGGTALAAAPLAPAHVAVLMNDNDKIRRLIVRGDTFSDRVSRYIRGAVNGKWHFQSNTILSSRLLTRLDIDADHIKPRATPLQLAAWSGNFGLLSYLKKVAIGSEEDLAISRRILRLMAAPNDGVQPDTKQ